jgi:CRISPR/Cas system-associated exonuclease Cas4 (RecB family)
MTLLAPDFQFSQRSLQDYVDCRRRFQLRYLQRLSWPAIEAEPMMEHENRIQIGAAFHRLVQRHLSGVPHSRLTAMLSADDSSGEVLNRWWENYLQYAGDFTAQVPAQTGHLVEGKLSAPLGAYRLIAKYDLIHATQEEQGLRVVIVDWKTSQQRPSRAWLADRLQTRVYSYLLVEAGAYFLEQGDIEPNQVEMVYWFPEHPQEPVRIPYNSQQHQQDQDYLLSLVKEIENLSEDEFPLTDDESRCRFCTYRSLCDRGIKAALREQNDIDLTEDQDIDLTFEFEDITEIEF